MEAGILRKNLFSGPMMLAGIVVAVIGVLLFSGGVTVARASFPALVSFAKGAEAPVWELPESWPIVAALEFTGAAAVIGGCILCLQAVLRPRRAARTEHAPPADGG